MYVCTHITCTNICRQILFITGDREIEIQQFGDKMRKCLNRNDSQPMNSLQQSFHRMCLQMILYLVDLVLEIDNVLDEDLQNLNSLFFFKKKK